MGKKLDHWEMRLFWCFYGSYCYMADAREVVKHSVALLMILGGIVMTLVGVVLVFLLN